MQKTTRVPVTIENIDGDGYHIFTTLEIEKIPFRALIDTGASKTVVSNTAMVQLKEASVLAQPATMAKGLGSQELTTGILLLKSIRLGKIKIESMLVGQLDLSHITLAYNGLGIQPFDVILGGDLLFQYQAVINYEKMWMKLKFNP